MNKANEYSKPVASDSYMQDKTVILPDFKNDKARKVFYGLRLTKTNASKYVFVIRDPWGFKWAYSMLALAEDYARDYSEYNTREGNSVTFEEALTKALSPEFRDNLGTWLNEQISLHEVTTFGRRLPEPKETTYKRLMRLLSITGDAATDSVGRTDCLPAECYLARYTAPRAK